MDADAKKNAVGARPKLKNLDTGVLIEIIEQQRQCIEEFRQAIEQLQRENEKLRAQLNKNSSNSHKPPSSDGPAAPKGKRKKTGKRRRGAQPGHKGTCRHLLAADEVDHVEQCKPACCVCCGETLSGDDSSPMRHQVTDIPPIKPFVTEYQLHLLTCTCCGMTTRADLPAGVSKGSFGPRLQAIIALFSGAYRLSKRNIQAILEDCFSVRLSVGSVCSSEQQISSAIAEPVEEAKAFVQEQSIVHADETGWREANKKAWLWTAVTSYVTVFLIRCSRAGDVAKELLGTAFSGYLVSDRWGGYGWLEAANRQLCWAHLLRDFESIAECSGTTGRRGRRLVNLGRKLFRLWGRVRDGTLARSSFKTYCSRIRTKVRGLLKRIEASGGEKSGMCKRLLNLESAMWTFVCVEGVAPTNNSAESAIRPVVLWRKGSFGTQSKRGSLFAERILTTVATLRQQKRNVLAYLTNAAEAFHAGSTAPTLLPTVAE
ncbi:MAG: IS66 family transposase [Thermodesulfobacteriota bacterium]|nr:IS66 family transposase [Thermodesulfobacteriota bacterium]